MASKCEKCVYYAKYDGACDFYLMTHVRRGCPADNNCRRYKTRLTKRVTKISYSKRDDQRKARNQEIFRRYGAGVSAAELASQYGMTKSGIYTILQKIREEKQRTEELKP